MRLVPVRLFFLTAAAIWFRAAGLLINTHVFIYKSFFADTLHVRIYSDLPPLTWSHLLFAISRYEAIALLAGGGCFALYLAISPRLRAKLA